MSIESAKAFIERMKTDEEFAQQVASKKNKEDRMKFVSEQGFDFTEGEIKDRTAELSEEEIQQVNGGFISEIDNIRQKVCAFFNCNDIVLSI